MYVYIKLLIKFYNYIGDPKILVRSNGLVVKIRQIIRKKSNPLEKLDGYSEAVMKNGTLHSV